MLRITAVKGTLESSVPGPTTLRLEGRVVGPWVRELTRICERERGPGRGLELEMTGVRFVDAEGVRLLKSLIARGVIVAGCSPFVRDQIEASAGG